MYFYKYMEPSHAEGLINFGTVRIGTLYEYRDSEDKRADKLEGSRAYEMRGSKVDTSQNSTESIYLRKMGFKNCIFENLNPSGSLVVTERLSKDCYIYCVSSEFNEENMAKFGGACIKIKAPNDFFTIIGSYLKKNGLVIGRHEMSEIFYCPQDKVYTFNEDVPKAIPGWCIKPNQYSPEKEVRFAWGATKETDLKPALITSDYVNFRVLEPQLVSIPELCKSATFERIA